jgi:hypothetical protein
VVERLAAFEVGYGEGRPMVVTQTNEQAFDLARRIARGFARLPVTLFVQEDLTVPADLSTLPNLSIARSPRAIPGGRHIVVANAKRWSWMDRAATDPFTLQLVDEAYQLPDIGFQQIAGLAPHIVLIGDPGQIDPIITCPIERWAGERDGPHVPCPDATLARYPFLRPLTLPVTRRLLPDTVRVIQPAFYPTLAFTALVPPDGRGLSTQVGGMLPADRAIDLACRGVSLVGLEAPARVTGQVDEDLARAIVTLMERLFARGASVRDGQTTRPLEPEMVGVVCAHRTQVAAVRDRLPSALAPILVETANRYQGLERAVMLVYHPLSGRVDASAFHLDAGRLCVALSRHRVVCFVFARAGIADLLRRYAPGGNRVLGIPTDPEFLGWRAHLTVLTALQKGGRVVPIR